MQAIAERSERKFSSKFMNTDEILGEMIKSRLAGEKICDLAKLFHDLLSEMIFGTVLGISERTKIKIVALSGGVFQNSLLSGLVMEKLRFAGLKVLRHELIPANDGGICIGQAIYAKNLV